MAEKKRSLITYKILKNYSFTLSWIEAGPRKSSKDEKKEEEEDKTEVRQSQIVLLPESVKSEIEKIFKDSKKVLECFEKAKTLTSLTVVEKYFMSEMEYSKDAIVTKEQSEAIVKVLEPKGEEILSSLQKTHDEQKTVLEEVRAQLPAKAPKSDSSKGNSRSR